MRTGQARVCVWGGKLRFLVFCSVLLFGDYCVYLVVNSKFALKSIAKVRTNKGCASRLHSNPQKDIMDSSGDAKVSKDKYVELHLRELIRGCTKREESRCRVEAAGPVAEKEQCPSDFKAELVQTVSANSGSNDLCYCFMFPVPLTNLISSY